MSLKALLPLLLAGAICAFGGTFTAGSPAGAESPPAKAGAQAHVATDLPGALAMARNALSIGRPDVAASIARQILAVMPDDPGAHMLLAAALTRSGLPEQAIPVAKAGFRLAEGKEARFEGAYLAAEAMAAAGRPWAAKLWLRKADLYAPTETHEAVLAQAYRVVSAQSRLGLAFALFGGPSENVNGGSLHDTFWLFGVLPIPIDEALPGQVYGFATQVSYRLSERMQGRLVWSHREVGLGDRALAIAPEARAQDYRQDELSLGLDHVWQNPAGRFAVLTSGAVGRRWTGGTASADFFRGSLEMRRAMDEDWSVAGRLTIEAVDIPGAADLNSLTSRLSFSTSHRADWLGAITLGAGVSDVRSDAAGIAWRGPTLALTWRPPIRSDAFGLTLDLEAERRDYWRTPTIAPDDWLSLSLTAELPSLEVMGFNPTVTVSASRTWSDVVVRDVEEIGISFGVSSQF